MELPQPQLALDPCVTKLHDSSPATVSLLGFFTGHLLAKRHHHRAFFQLRYGTAVLLVVWATLRFARTASAILKPGFVEVVSHPCSYLTSPRRMQDFAPPGKHSGSSPADTGMRSVETGSASWRHAAHLRVACSPENRPLAWPSSRYSLAWCSRYRPPSVAAFSPVAAPRDPPLAVTVPCRWPPVSPPLPQSVHALHPWKSARCS